MTYHKFTDEEVVKALEICSLGQDAACDGCPLNFADMSIEECMESAIINALDLINRQKAELADLREIVFMDRTEAIKNLKAEAIKEFAEMMKDNRDRIFNTVYSNYHFGELIDGIVEEMVGGQ